MNMKVKSNVRFANLFDGKVYESGDEFDALEADAEYLLKHKIVSEVKSKPEPKKEVKK